MECIKLRGELIPPPPQNVLLTVVNWFDLINFSSWPHTESSAIQALVQKGCYGPYEIRNGQANL